MAFWSGYDHLLLGDTFFHFWRDLALTPRYTSEIPNILPNLSHHTWLVFLIVSTTDNSATVSTGTYRGTVVDVFSQLKRRMQSHTRANAAVRSITFPAGAIPVSEHRGGVH